MSYDSDKVTDLQYLVTEELTPVLVFRRKDGTFVVVPIPEASAPIPEGTFLNSAVAVDPSTKPNPAWGGDMTVDYAHRVDDVIWAFGNPGDEYPRVLFTADGYIFFGDGTYDPYHASETAWIQQSRGTYGGLKFVAASVLEFIAQEFIKFTTQVHFHGNVSFVAGNVITDTTWSAHTNGPVVTAPGGGRWRIVVDDTGNLSTVSI